MNQFKECTIKLLNTNETTPLIFNLKNEKLSFGKPVSKEFIRYGEIGKHLYILSNELITIGDWYLIELFDITAKSTGFHLEQCVSINEKKWVNDADVISTRHINNCKKIIATTNTILNLSRPSDKFLIKFCEMGNIEKILVEYKVEYYADSKPFATEYSRNAYVQEQGASHSCWTKFLFPKIAPDKTITIKKIPTKLYTEKEVREIALGAYNYGDLMGTGEMVAPLAKFETWFEENK